MKISIGIYVDGQLERLRWTLASINANTSNEVELLLLLDGVVLNETVARALPAWNRLKVSGTSDARGTAACFNRLASLTDADVLVLLRVGRTGGARLARSSARRTRFRSAQRSGWSINKQLVE